MVASEMLRERENARLDELRELLERAALWGPAGLSTDELLELPRLYRHASTILARLRAGGHAPERARELERLVHRAHDLLHRNVGASEGAGGAVLHANPLARAVRFLLVSSPRAIRAEWKLLATSFAVFYGLALGAYLWVRSDLEMAFVLYSPDAVAHEIEQLRATEDGEPFRGNFTFGLGSSPQVAGWILAHNISVALLFFGAGLLPRSSPCCSRPTR